MSTTDALKAQLTPATAPAQQLKANSLIDVVRSKGFQTQMALALPKSMTADRGKVTHVYAVAKLKGGGVQFEVMSRAEIEKIRQASKAGNTGSWSTHWDEMAKKTVIRRLFKYLPLSIEAARAVEIDEKSDRGEAVTQQEFLEGEFIDKGTPETFSQTAPASDQPESGV